MSWSLRDEVIQKRGVRIGRVVYSTALLSPKATYNIA